MNISANSLIFSIALYLFLISVNDISVYENYIKIEERKLMDLNPIFSDDINVLKEIRNKYNAIE